jgi:hypothetical protein
LVCNENSIFSAVETELSYATDGQTIVAQNRLNYEMCSGLLNIDFSLKFTFQVTIYFVIMEGFFSATIFVFGLFKAALIVNIT